MTQYTSSQLLLAIQQSHTAHSSKTACKCQSNLYTYAELEHLSDIIAHHISNHLIVNGLDTDMASTIRIGVNMERTINLLPAIYAITKMGCCYVPIDTNVPAERKAFIADDAQIALMLTDDLVNRYLSEQDVEHVILHYNQPEAYIIYTSGTTGKPKGVPISYSSLFHFLLHLKDEDNIQLDSNSVLLLFASINFDVSIIEIFGTLFYGATMVIAQTEDKQSARNIVSIINNEHITYALIPPSLLAIMETFDFASLKTLVSAGEPMQMSVAERIVGKKPYRFINGYGPTECTVLATQSLIADPKRCNNIGKPMNGVVAYVVDNNGQPVEAGEEGELLLGGIQLSKGYLNRPEQNEKAFFVNPFEDTKEEAPVLYHTGDIVRYEEDGTFQFIGRCDNQVKVHGYRIELGDITTHIQACDGVAAAYVRVEEICGDKQLVAYLVLDNDSVDINLIKHNVGLQLPYYMIPSFWNVIDKFPLNINGKIDNSKLENKAISNITHNDTELTDHEEHIMQVIANVLNISSLNIDLDLIDDIGLTSIQLMRIQYELERSAVGISVAGIYKYRTIRTIAQHSLKEAAYWYNADSSTTKPVIVIISGFTDFSYMYTKIAERLTKDYAIYVIESYHNILSNVDELSSDTLINIYIDMLKEVKAKHHIACIAGICNGGDQALLLAHRMFADSEYKPLVVNMDGEIDRDADPEKNASIDFPFFSEEVNKRRNNLDLSLYASYPKFHYDGPLGVFLCRDFFDYWTPLDPNMTPKKDYWMRRFFDTNAERWKRTYPELEITTLPASHADFWLTDPSLTIITDYIKAETK